ncbi:Rv3654c family TadE-like protein [Desertivibrio insolitus]|uniref:Rv3654c family TadE-like protein n=1 Tax=Herbiconiux sp. SYSU D00978 TaxID=2812562 RepID=UPI001A9716B9|nr:Rv3654c family TadE-like protein [Herbiconiux sp. SYSU D00978]
MRPSRGRNAKWRAARPLVAGRSVATWLGDTRGAGSVTVVGIAAAIALAAVLVIAVGGALVVRQRVAGAADAAALAAADTASGRLPGVPCVAAAEVAAANGAELDGCLVEGLVVTVRAAAVVGALPVTATATAGPPSEE